MSQSQIVKDNTKKRTEEQELGISIMTDPELHPLPITPNDPLSIFQTPNARFAQSFQQRTAANSAQMMMPGKRESTSELIQGVNNLFSAQSENSPLTKDDSCDIEISNTEDKPNSMFKKALPSLKLNIENKLSPDQQSQLEKKRVEIRASLEPLLPQANKDSDGMLQGQGSSSKHIGSGSILDVTSPQKSKVLDQMPESVK